MQWLLMDVVAYEMKEKVHPYSSIIANDYDFTRITSEYRIR